MTVPGAGREGGGDLLAILTDRKAAVTTARVGAVTAQLRFVSSSERSEPLGPGRWQFSPFHVEMSSEIQSIMMLLTQRSMP